MNATHTHTYTSEERATEAGIIADIALATGEHTPIGETAATVLLPRGSELRVIDPEALAETPARPRGTVRPQTVDGLLAYCHQHDDGKTECWINEQEIVAVLNGSDGDKGVGWGDHRAVLTLQHSPQWNHWASLSGQMVDQATLAEHIEDGALDIRDPESAKMLEIVQSLQVSRSASFRSSTHLHSGVVGFTYDEQDKATAGPVTSGNSGTLEIPTEFELGIPVFLGEDGFKVTARFRYRLKEGQLTLGYKLDRPDLVVQEAVEAIAERLEKDDSGAPFEVVYRGKPAGPVEPGRLSLKG